MFWEVYGPFAIGSFDSIGFNQSAKYSFEIRKKGYNTRPKLIPPDTYIWPEPIISCLCAGNPAVLRYLNDDIIGIKGAECILTLINKDGKLPLNTFYSDEEDTYKLILKVTYEEANVQVTKTLFEGYLIQEDSNEILTDIAHEIQLSFTDNLGALKNLDFDVAAKVSPLSDIDLRINSINALSFGEFTFGGGTPLGIQRQSNGVKLFNPIFTAPNPNVGDYIFLNDSPIGDFSGTIIDINTVGTDTFIYIREQLRPFGLTSSVKIAFITGSYIYDKITLADAFRICLHATNLKLNIQYAGSINIVDTDLDFFNKVYIDARSFQNGENAWLSCYEVLERLCKKFNISLFQQDGKWNLIRFIEAPQYANIISGILFDSYFSIISTGTFTNQISLGNGNDIETGIEKSIIRPCNFVSETFEYITPNNLLFNNSLSLYGQKRLTQSNNPTAGIKLNRYDAVGFTEIIYPGNMRYSPYIHKLVYMNDDSQTEFDRYLVIRYESGTPFQIYEDQVIKSDPIEVNKGDRLKYTFSWRHQFATDTSSDSIRINLVYGTGANDYYYLTNDVISGTDQLKWASPSNPGPNIVRDINATEFTNYTLESSSFPISGQLVFYFGNRYYVGSLNTNRERWYKDLSVEIINQMFAKREIKAHSNKASVNQITKSNIKNDVYFSDTFKNSIKGTFFKATFTNLIRDLVSGWKDVNFPINYTKLNEITTREILNWRKKPRAKLEGNILGILSSTEQLIKFNNIFIFLGDTNSFYIFGKMEYNLKSDQIKFTAYELYNLGEDQNTAYIRNNVDHEFKYLYK